MPAALQSNVLWTAAGTRLWHSSLTEDNKNDLERVQKSVVRIVVGNRYKGNIKSLETLELQTLEVV